MWVWVEEGPAGGKTWDSLWLQVQAWCPSDEGLRHHSPGGGFYAKLDRC